jgi:hypothetical protein
MRELRFYTYVITLLDETTKTSSHTPAYSSPLDTVAFLKAQPLSIPY